MSIDLTKLQLDARDGDCPNAFCTGTFSIKHCSDSDIEYIMVFQNGMVAAFGKGGQQLPDMQGHIVHLLKNAARHVEQNREYINEARRIVERMEESAP